MLGYSQIVKGDGHVSLKDLGTLVDKPCPLFRAVQVQDLLQDIPHTNPNNGPPAKEEEIG
jgi:hypothetical protein